MTSSYEHEINVPLPVADALQLFTPKGEEAWINHWRPTYVQPTDGRTQKDMIFKTGDGDDTTFWTCLDWEPDQGRVRYLRVTPASRVTFVKVECRPAAEGTNVQVQYQFVALNEAGSKFIAGIGPADFAQMIQSWSDMIAGYLHKVRHGDISPVHG